MLNKLTYIQNKLDLPKKINTYTKWLLMLCLATQLVCCRKEENGYKIYEIKKWHHYCEWPRWDFTWFQEKFDFIFDEACVYDGTIPWRNKVWGIGWEVHEESARIWRRSNDWKILLAYYVYWDSKRTIETVDTVSVNDANHAEVHYVKDSVEIDVNWHHKKFHSKKAIPFRCYPYFGGDDTAPHDMKILINHLSD